MNKQGLMQTSILKEYACTLSNKSAQLQIQLFML